MDYSFDAVGNVLGYTNEAHDYTTNQRYGYDDLYQLVDATGDTVSRAYGLDEYRSGYHQSFAFDDIGNMTGKVSTSTTTPRQTIGQELNYTLDYSYYAGKSHQAERIGDIWYRYDANGNVSEARQGGHSESSSTDGQVVAQGDVRWTSEGFGLDRGGQGGQEEKKVWARYYSWDEENRLRQSVEGDLSVEYRYGSDGQRAVKYSKRGENLYFDAMWSESINGASIRQSKHVYVGQTRVSTRLNYKGHPDTGFEQANTYYYHGDHLGSAQLVTDPDGQEYEHIEYTPYGELWVEKTRDGIDAIPFRFTGKELDAETGLYYYGARYLDPKTSVWLSADPALGEYVPGAPVDEEARKRNGNLPGMGGVFNTVNLHLYHYAGNNPIKYTDPSGLAYDEPDVAPGQAIQDKKENEVILQEIDNATTLANKDPHPTYGTNPDLAGEVVSMDLTQYDCISELSAVTGTPLLSTAELADPAVRGAYFDDVSAGQELPGDWILVRYTLPGSSTEDGHVQMILPTNQYADSAPVADPGPRITTGNPVSSTVPNVLGGTLTLSVIIRPKR